jgi:lipoate-protein ligase B
VPCGLEGVQITSIQRESGRAENLTGFRAVMAQEFAVAFEHSPVPVDPEQLVGALSAAVAG